ncbi:MAG: sugar transferase [Planctomyces sp.]|nr:sugar transferase [Planctomyces sp.]
MSTQLLSPPTFPLQTAQHLEDVVEYASSEEIPAVHWLTPLWLDQPRANLRCLSPQLRVAKRIIDVVLSLALLAVLWPVMLMVAIAVRVTSPGPIIFRQTRVGLNLRGGDDRRNSQTAASAPERRSAGPDRRGNFAYGRHFTLYKFRTMRQDAERHGARFATPGDSRVTPIGRFLRRTRLDELPQLWNILKGEMSLVGPRPERPEFVSQLSQQIPDYLQRLGLKPGLTGVAQIVNGYDNEIEGFRRKVAFDVLYLQNCSLWNDVKILIRTIGTVLSGSGAL